MIKNTEAHGNRTGMAATPAQARTMVEADAALAGELRYDDGAERDGLTLVRMEYAREGFTVGTMPPTLKNAGQTVVRSKRGNFDFFLDKLGERLAFERTGVRLYEALLSKWAVHGTWSGGPSEQDLQHIRGEELAHFTMLREEIARLGGDATALTPSANIHAVASQGLAMVLADPRTDLEDCLEAILVAELEDNDCWETLLAMSQTSDLAPKIQAALADERQHLALVRGWLKAALT